MSFKTICDHCQQTIENPKDKVNVTTNFKSKDFHIDCFNYFFSTNFRDKQDLWK